MTTVVVERSGTLDELAPFLVPRSDLLVEEAIDEHRWGQSKGPFTRYSRTVDVKPAQSKPTADTADTDPSTWHLVETTDFRLAIPIWRPLFTPLMKRALADVDRQPRRRWWWPMEVLTARSAVLVSVLTIISIMAGYLGVVIGQTLTFAAEEFGADEAAQGRTFAAVRVGVLLSLVFIGRADRIGRRPLLISFALGSILLTAAGALSTSLMMLGVTQALARGLDTGLLTLLTLAATEEVPAGVRGLALSLMTMCAGLGAGMVVWVLPVADTSVGAWRWVYVAPLIFLPVLFWCWRTMPETRRFDVAATTEAPGVVDRRRFGLLAVTAFAAALFLSPASQFQNDYLNDERGFSAAKISLFRVLISTPVGLVILAAGVIADRRGRKPLGTGGLALGAAFGLFAYFVDGAMLWAVSLLSVWTLGASYPALRGYQTEMFPTRARARVGGWLDVISVTGSAIGLLVVGELATRWGSLGPALSVLIWGPLLAIVIIWFAFPETASRELEDFNPEDPDLSGTGSGQAGQPA